MIHLTTIMNLCIWENSLPCENNSTQIENIFEKMKRISKGLLKLSEEEWSDLTNQVIRNLVD